MDFDLWVRGIAIVLLLLVLGSLAVGFFRGDTDSPEPEYTFRVGDEGITDLDGAPLTPRFFTFDSRYHTTGAADGYLTYRLAVTLDNRRTSENIYVDDAPFHADRQRLLSSHKLPTIDACLGWWKGKRTFQCVYFDHMMATLLLGGRDRFDEKGETTLRRFILLHQTETMTPREDPVAMGEWLEKVERLFADEIGRNERIEEKLTAARRLMREAGSRPVLLAPYDYVRDQIVNDPARTVEMRREGGLMTFELRERA